MGKYIITFVIALLFSCSNTDDTTVLSKDFPQTWKLVQVNVGISGQIFNEDELPWEESLLLNANNTFLRTRTFDDQIFTGIGKFQFINLNNESQLVLVHDEESQLVENCSGNNEERLRVITMNQLSGGAVPCDGPGLLYRLIE